jgi:hypothetical protein
MLLILIGLSDKMYKTLTSEVMGCQCQCRAHQPVFNGSSTILKEMVLLRQVRKALYKKPAFLRDINIIDWFYRSYEGQVIIAFEKSVP